MDLPHSLDGIPGEMAENVVLESGVEGPGFERQRERIPVLKNDVVDLPLIGERTRLVQVCRVVVQSSDVTGRHCLRKTYGDASRPATDVQEIHPGPQIRQNERRLHARCPERILTTQPRSYTAGTHVLG